MIAANDTSVRRECFACAQNPPNRDWPNHGWGCGQCEYLGAAF